MTRSSIFISGALIAVLTGPAAATEEWAKVTSSVPEAGSGYATGLAIGDGVIAVAADRAFAGEYEGSGAVHLYERSGATWVETARLRAPTDPLFARFGWSVEFCGDRLMVGSTYVQRLDPIVGRVYEYQRVDDTWQLTDTIFASDATDLDRFGGAIACDGDTLIVSAPEYRNASLKPRGTLYVFERIDDAWVEVDKLVPADLDPAGDVGIQTSSYGVTVALDGDLLVVGSPFDKDFGGQAGAAYVWERVGGVWTEAAKLYGSAPAEDYSFGESVDVEAATIVVGRPGDGGAVHVYEKVDGAWTEIDELTAAEAVFGDGFGFTAELSGDRLLAGLRLSDQPGLSAGSAVLFTREAGAWSEGPTLRASDAAEGDQYGIMVALEGDVALVGASREDTAGEDTGTVYVYGLDDADGDGFPPSADCDDTDPLVNPRMAEIPANGIDDDCDPTTPGGCQPSQ